MMAQQQRHDSAVEDGLEATCPPLLRSSKSEGGRAKADAVTRRLAAVSADYARRGRALRGPDGSISPTSYFGHIGAVPNHAARFAAT
jgi:hypothetical protein